MSWHSLFLSSAFSIKIALSIFLWIKLILMRTFYKWKLVKIKVSLFSLSRNIHFVWYYEFPGEDVVLLKKQTNHRRLVTCYEIWIQAFVGVTAGKKRGARRSADCWGECRQAHQSKRCLAAGLGSTTRPDWGKARKILSSNGFIL